MSNKILTWVWENSQEEDTKLLVLLALADNANDEGIAWPSLATIAHKIRRSRKQTQRLVRELEAAGELRIYRRKTDDGRNRSNVYLVVTALPRASHQEDDLVELPPDESLFEAEDDGQPETPPAEPGGDSPIAMSLYSPTAMGPGVVPQLWDTEPSIEPSLNPTGTDKPPVPDALIEIPPGVKNPGAYRALVQGMKSHKDNATLRFPEQLRPWVQVFIDQTNIIPLERDKGYWIKGIRDMIDRGVTLDTFRKAIQKMKQEHLNLFSPGSVVKVAESLQAASTRDDDDDALYRHH